MELRHLFLDGENNRNLLMLHLMLFQKNFSVKSHDITRSHAIANSNMHFLIPLFEPVTLRNLTAPSPILSTFPRHKFYHEPRIDVIDYVEQPIKITNTISSLILIQVRVIFALNINRKGHVAGIRFQVLGGVKEKKGRDNGLCH